MQMEVSRDYDLASRRPRPTSLLSLTRSLAAVTVAASILQIPIAAQAASRTFIRTVPSLTDQTYVTVPATSDRFVDTVGADSEFGNDSSPYGEKFTSVAALLIASKIRHLRDSDVTGTVYDSRMKYLYDHGIKHSIGFQIGEDITAIKSAVTAEVSETEFVEGPNEYDNSGDPNWAHDLRLMQNKIYDTVSSMPIAKNMTIVGPALDEGKNFPLLGNTQSIEDVGALHESSCDYNPETYHSDSVANWFLTGRISTPTKPIWITEAGYTTDMTRPCSVPTSIAAKYDPRLVATYFNDGGPRLYFFQLVNMPTDPIFGGKGLIDQYGHAKAQFTALSSLLNLLSDPGPNFSTEPLGFSLGGDTTGLGHTLLQRRNGTYELLLWLAVPSWNHDTRKAIDVPAQSVTITLQNRAARLPRGGFIQPVTSGSLLYTYNSLWGMHAAPVVFVGGTTTIHVTDSISVLEFK